MRTTNHRGARRRTEVNLLLPFSDVSVLVKRRHGFARVLGVHEQAQTGLLSRSGLGTGTWNPPESGSRRNDVRIASAPACASVVNMQLFEATQWHW